MKTIIVLVVLYCLYQGHAVKYTYCPKNWIRFGDSELCYYISDNYASFNVAKKQCENKKSQFATVSTDYDEYLMSSILAPERDKCDGYGNCLEFWIGVRRYYFYNAWETIENMDVLQTNRFWAKGYPRSNGSCVLMSFEDNGTKGLWKNENCERPLKFACIRNANCPDGFTYVPEIDQCLYLNREPRHWYDARWSCTSIAKGARMVMITNSVKQQAVREYLQQHFKDYTGCVNRFSPETGNIAWIGGQTSDRGRCGTPYFWKSSEGAFEIPFTYTNWYPGRPDCLLDSENCVLITSSPEYNYRWEDNPCGWTFCSVCEL